MLILNADDFGISPGASKGILNLVALGRLSAYSLMVNCNHWREYRNDIESSRTKVSVGLHLNLTEGSGIEPIRLNGISKDLPNCAKLIAQCLSRQVDIDWLRREISSQFDLFENTLGITPDHIDGHQHVHMLPVVRQVLTQELKKRSHYPQPLLRQSNLSFWNPKYDGLNVLAKSLIVRAAGIGAVTALNSDGFPHNERFLGFANLERNKKFSKQLCCWLRPSDSVVLVMCHPGIDKTCVHDPLAARRYYEFSSILKFDRLPEILWRPGERIGSQSIDWKHEMRTRQ